MSRVFFRGNKSAGSAAKEGAIKILSPTINLGFMLMSFTASINALGSIGSGHQSFPQHRCSQIFRAKMRRKNGVDLFIENRFTFLAHLCESFNNAMFV